MTFLTFFRHLRRDSRGNRSKLLFFVACLMIGVAAVVAVAGFCEALERGVAGQTRQLIAADFTVRGRHPIPDDVKEAIDQIPGARRTDVREMMTLVAAVRENVDDPDTAATSQLVELKCLDGTYPFYGALEIDPPRPLAELLDEHSAVVAPELLVRLGLGENARLRIGGEEFRVVGQVFSEPDRVADAFSMGPRVFLSGAGLARAGLEQHGSRILYRTLVALPPELAGELDETAKRLRRLLPKDRRHRLQTYREAQQSLRQGIRRMERYLGLAALLSLLVGGVGVAQTVRAWLAGRLDAIAVLKCLGYRPREVFALYLGQAAVLGVVASLLGIGLGIALEAVVAQLLQDVLPVENLDLWQGAAMLRGLLLGSGIAVVFSLPPLAAAQRVPPARVLRRDAEPLPMSRPTVALVALGLVSATYLLASWQAGSFLLGLAFTAALIVVTLVLAAAAQGLTRLAVRPRRLTRMWMRQGLAALGRPGASTTSATVALGLGVLVVLTMYLVERRLSAQFDADVPADAPNAFLIDIQTDQWPLLQPLLDAEAEAVDSVPVVMARFQSINGVAVEDLVDDRSQASDDDQDGDDQNSDSNDRRWALRREQRLTYLDELPAGNRITHGALWSDSGRGEVSIESDYASYLDVDVGAEIVIDVQGVPVELLVSSIRTVDWGTFGINFFMVVEPGVLDEAPQHRIAAVRLPPEREQALQDELTERFPNVTMIRIREVLERIVRILGQLGLGVRLLGFLTVFAGLAILAGAVSATAVERGAEVALLKTLGMTRRQVASGFATEYALIGLVAGVVGSAGAGAVSFLVLVHGMELTWSFDLLGHGGAVVLAVVLAVGAGLAASVWPLARRPVEALRAAD
jgi:putative ABC transport system permease protein